MILTPLGPTSPKEVTNFKDSDSQQTLSSTKEQPAFIPSSFIPKEPFFSHYIFT